MDKIVEILRNGGVVALPTDNLFCLAADASNETAVNKIFEIKGRSDSSAIPILIADFSELKGLSGVRIAIFRFTRNFTETL